MPICFQYYVLYRTITWYDAYAAIIELLHTESLFNHKSFIQYYPKIPIYITMNFNY